LDTLSLLVKLGADANILNANNFNSLMYYVQYCQNPSLEVIKLLSDAGSDVKLFSKFGNTILHLAAFNKNCKFEILQYLIKLGADVSIVNNKTGENVLMKYV